MGRDWSILRRDAAAARRGVATPALHCASYGPGVPWNSVPSCAERRVKADKKRTAGKKRTPISPVFEPKAAMSERILVPVYPLMKKMVLHDLMRVQITKISVYVFYPLYFFLTALALIPQFCNGIRASL